MLDLVVRTVTDNEPEILTEMTSKETQTFITDASNLELSIVQDKFNAIKEMLEEIRTAVREKEEDQKVHEEMLMKLLIQEE